MSSYLHDVESAVRTDVQQLEAPWALYLRVGLPGPQLSLAHADLDNFLFPVASLLRNLAKSSAPLVSAWCTKHVGARSSILIAGAARSDAPGPVAQVHTTASAESSAFKEQVASQISGAAPLPPGPVHVQLSYVVGPMRNWLNLWKPTIDALGPILGSSSAGRPWNPGDGRITELGLHVRVDAERRHDVDLQVSARLA